MKTIKVISPPIPEPTFATPQEALAYRSPRNAQLEKDTLGMKNKVIVGGSWTDSQFELYLSNSKTLRFVIEGVKVGWRVEPRSPAAAAQSTRETAPLSLEIRSGPNQRPRLVVWDREALFRKCIGRRFKKVVAGAAYLWLYLEAKPTLLFFSKLIGGPGEKDLLYWTEER